MEKICVIDSQASGISGDKFLASLIDLGTEFGVNVVPDKSSEFHVFKGRVSLRKKKNGSEQAGQIINAGQARQIDHIKGKINEVVLRKSMFTKRIPSSYEIAIRESQPAAYWQFGRDDDRVVENLMPGRSYVGKYIGSAKRLEIGTDFENGQKLNAVH